MEQGFNLTLTDLMNDSTERNTTGIPTTTMQESSSRVYLYFFQAINIIMIAIIVWVLTNTIVFGLRTRQWRASLDKTKVDRGKIYTVCIVAIASTLPRLVMSQFLFHEDMLGRCELLMDVGIVAFSLSLWLVYLFLWLRHRAIYAHPTVKNVMGKYSNCVSWFLLTIVTTASLAVMIAFVYPRDYTHTIEGCVIKEKAMSGPDAITFWDVGANYILGGFLFVSQLLFLMLFIYPMVVTKKIRKEQQRSHCDVTNGAQKCRSFGGIMTKGCGKVCKVKEMDNISSVIYRSVVSSTIAVSTDLFVALAVGMILPGSVSRAVTVSLYDVSLVINVFCMLATFDKNGKILCNVCRRSMERSVSTGSLNSTPKSNNKTASTEIW